MGDERRHLSEPQEALLKAITLHLHLQSTRNRQSVQLTVFGVGAALLGVMLLFALTMIHSVFYIIALVIGAGVFTLFGYRTWVVYGQRQRTRSLIELLDEQLPYSELGASDDGMGQADLDALIEAFPQLDDT